MDNHKLLLEFFENNITNKMILSKIIKILDTEDAVVLSFKNTPIVIKINGKYIYDKRLLKFNHHINNIKIYQKYNIANLVIKPIKIIFYKDNN